jgi:hypothetical protein
MSHTTKHFNLIQLATAFFFSLINLVSINCSANSQDTNKTSPPINSIELINQLKINQGMGEFTQKKYFTFLAHPVESKGRFIINQSSILWQTESPIFSQLLIGSNAIYQRLDKQEEYQILTENSELSTILTTLLKGEINSSKWQSNPIDNACLKLEPNDQQLKQLFDHVTMCRQNKSQRQVILFDQHQNKTEITMQITTATLEQKDLEKLSPEH